MPPQTVFVVIALLSIVALIVRVWVLKMYMSEISIFKILHSVFLPSGLLATVCLLLFVCYHKLELMQYVNPIITIVASMLIVVLFEAGIGLNVKERKIIRQTVTKWIG